MAHRWCGFQTTFGIPDEAFGNEVNKALIVTSEHLRQGLGSRLSAATFGVHDWSWSASGVEKEFLPRAAVDQVLIRHTENLHNARELFLLVLAREDREASVQLSKNAAKTPHVDSHVVIHAKNHFGRTIKAALDVRVDFLVFKAATTEVDNLDATFVWTTKQDVLRLKVAMYNPVMTHQGQGSQHLTSESPDESCREPDEAVCLDELVKVDAQQLHGDAQVTAEIKVLSHLDHMVLLFRIPFPKVVQDLDLDERLMVEAFLVADDFDGGRLAGCVVSTLKDLPERTFPKCANDLIPICQVIVLDNQVIATLIVIAVVVSRVSESCGFLLAVSTKAVDRGIVQNLFPLIL